MKSRKVLPVVVPDQIVKPGRGIGEFSQETWFEVERVR